MTIYFLGGGNMAAAIVAGLCQAERTAEIHVANRGAEKTRGVGSQIWRKRFRKIAHTHQKRCANFGG